MTAATMILHVVAHTIHHRGNVDVIMIQAGMLRRRDGFPSSSSVERPPRDRAQPLRWRHAELLPEDAAQVGAVREPGGGRGGTQARSSSAAPMARSKRFHRRYARIGSPTSRAKAWRICRGESPAFAKGSRGRRGLRHRGTRTSGALPGVAVPVAYAGRRRGASDESARLLPRGIARDAHVECVAGPRLAPALGVAREPSARRIVSVEEQDGSMFTRAVSMGQSWGNDGRAGPNASVGTVVDVQRPRRHDNLGRVVRVPRRGNEGAHVEVERPRRRNEQRALQPCRRAQRSLAPSGDVATSQRSSSSQVLSKRGSERPKSETVPQSAPAMSVAADATWRPSRRRRRRRRLSESARCSRATRHSSGRRARAWSRRARRGSQAPGRRRASPADAAGRSSCPRTPPGARRAPAPRL